MEKKMARRVRNNVRFAPAVLDGLEEIARRLGVPLNAVVNFGSFLLIAQCGPYLHRHKAISIDVIEREVAEAFVACRQVIETRQAPRRSAL